MKKELGKWLMDISKYITTAVILTSIFGDVQEKWVIYVGGSIAVILTLVSGLWLVRGTNYRTTKRFKKKGVQ